MSSEKKALIVNCQGISLRKSGGAGRYCREMVKRIERISHTGQLPEVKCYIENFQAGDDTAGETSIDRLALTDRVKHAVAALCPPLLVDYVSKRHRERGASSSDSPKRNNKHRHFHWQRRPKGSLLHEITNYDIIDQSARISRDRNIVFAVTFLDIQDYYYPDYFSNRVLNKRKLLYSYYKDRFEVFFATSQFTKESMIEHLGIPPEKITVTHLAADDKRYDIRDEEWQKRAESLGRYLIYPAKLWPHKNHDFLFRSLQKRKGELARSGLSLILTGGFNALERKQLEKYISDYSIGDIVRIIGFVLDEQLKELIRNAEFLIFPSLFEGFGMPILEAMSLGCPVISSNAASLPEVGGDGPIYFDPTSEDQLIAILDSVISGKEIDRSEMIRKGYENCKRFSWDKTFIETLKIYKKFLE